MAGLPTLGVVIEDLAAGGCASTAGPSVDDNPPGELPDGGLFNADFLVSETVLLVSELESATVSSFWCGVSISASLYHG
ncbi:hypothetical protein CUJ88_45600 (plasmid) [Paraburkholderia hospita]|nr:hypothetical protein CUJ88_45600 [Paraburkholderia hospita]